MRALRAATTTTIFVVFINAKTWPLGTCAFCESIQTSPAPLHGRINSGVWAWAAGKIMQVREITKSDALSLSSQPEGHFYDRKAAQIKGAKLQRIVCAFANSDGGDVYVGIADDKHESAPHKRWHGASSMEEYNQLIQSTLEIRPSPPVLMEFLKSPLSSNYVLHIQVDKSQSVHHTADGAVYERKGAQSLPIKDVDRITALSFAKGASSYEDMHVDSADAEDVVDSDEIKVFLDEYSPRTDPLDLSINKGLIDRRTFKPKACGLVLFSNDPGGVMPKKCSVKIVRYETKEDDPERDHLAFTETVEGPLFPLIRSVVSRVTAIMSSISVWTTEGAKSMQYPPETLWEIVVNALIHRDYSISDDVQVLIFDNRIEVLSPGRLPGFVSRDNILDVRYARNPKIVGMLSKYSDAPNKDIGEGLNTAFQKMKEWKMRSPESSMKITTFEWLFLMPRLQHRKRPSWNFCRKTRPSQISRREISLGLRVRTQLSRSSTSCVMLGR